MSDDSRCTFEVPASSLPGDSKLRETDDGDWRCHRRADVGDVCVFHADPADRPCSDAEVSRRLVEAVRGPPDPGAFVDVDDPRTARREAKRLLGLRADHLDMSRERLDSDDTLALDLRNSDVDRLDVGGAEFGTTVDLSGATLGYVAGEDATFERALLGVDATVDGGVDLADARIDGGVDFQGATVGDVVVDGARVGRDLRFAFATLDSLSARKLDGRCRLNLKEATVDGEVDCTDVELDGERYARIAATTLRGGTVTGDVTFAGGSLAGNIQLNELRVGGDLDFRSATVTGNLWAGSRDDARAELGPVHVDRDLLFADLHVGGDLDLAASDGDIEGPILAGVADLSGVHVEGTLGASPRFEHPRLRVVDLSGATLPDGHLGQPPAGDVVYLLDGATVGDVSFDAGRYPAADHVRFLETEFDGFQFARDRRTFDRVGWTIHQVGGDPADLAYAARYREARLLATDALVALRSFEGTAEAVASLDPPVTVDAVREAWFPTDTVRRWIAAGKEPFKLTAPPPVVEQERTRLGFTRLLAGADGDTPDAVRAVLDDDAVDTLVELAGEVAAEGGSAADGEARPPRSSLVGRVATIVTDDDAVRPAYEGLAADLDVDGGDWNAAVEAVAHRARRSTRRWGIDETVPPAYDALVDELTDRVAAALSRTDDPRPSFDRLETTYLLAKNGANEVGDTGTAAGEFYIHEKTYRRKFHWGSAWATDGLLPDAGSLYDWASNALLGLTSGYGERPRRVVVFSTGVVVLFAGVFATQMETPPYHPSLGYLLVSLESFITLVLGGAAAIENPEVRLLAQMEGFLGAFLIALFVFTLTRSIDR